MPRRNSNVTEQKKRDLHGATIFHDGYRVKCVGCLFVGHNFACNTSDGKCLKAPLPIKSGRKREMRGQREAVENKA